MRTGTAGSARAARFIEKRFREAGLEAAGDSGFYQLVPMSLTVGRSGRMRPRVLESWAAWDTLPEDGRIKEANIVGILPGSDPELRDEYILVTAHYDHVGVGRPVDGDSIYNGADDDASGTAALIWIAESLAAAETRPARSIVFAAVTGEEMGLLGTRWYITDPPVPLEQTVANLNIEMIARPDPVTGPGRGWLTGYERTTMGEMLTAAGLPIDPDPHPEQNYYERSDNIAFARLGIPAHTLSIVRGTRRIPHARRRIGTGRRGAHGSPRRGGGPGGSRAGRRPRADLEGGLRTPVASTQQAAGLRHRAILVRSLHTCTPIQLHFT